MFPPVERWNASVAYSASTHIPRAVAPWKASAPSSATSPCSSKSQDAEVSAAPREALGDSQLLTVTPDFALGASRRRDAAAPEFQPRGTHRDWARKYFERCRAIVEDAEAAHDQLVRDSSSPKGKIRMSVPVDFGLLFVAPALAEFARLYPELTFEVDMSPRRVDLVAERYDLAIRVGDTGAFVDARDEAAGHGRGGALRSAGVSEGGRRLRRRRPIWPAIAACACCSPSRRCRGSFAAKGRRSRQSGSLGSRSTTSACCAN